MKFGEIAQVTKREAIVGVLVCLCYIAVLLSGIWFAHNYLRL